MLRYLLDHLFHFYQLQLRVFHLTLSSCFSTFCDNRCICKQSRCKHQLHQPHQLH
ncbi:hypothetical protein GBA52_008006 [Prunus armeniaca]|nr:hypothetical protein GBA52_008006 [Prunus armeniaca]